MPATGSRLRRARWQAPAGIQYSRGVALRHAHLCNTGSPGRAGRRRVEDVQLDCFVAV